MIAALVLILLFFVQPAAAHDARPLAVTITEQDSAHLRLDWRAPGGAVEARNAPRARLAGACEALHDEPPHALAGRALYRCEGGLAGAELVIDYLWFNPSLSTLVRVVRGGETQTALLPPDRLTWRAEAPAGVDGVAGGYFLLGVEHILIGIDHVLFLAGLLILARTPARILLTVTGFTIAHSVTLILVARDVVRVSIPAVEATIALSVVFVAAEIARNNRATLAWRRPAIVAAAFGLLHGAGFAAALGEIGLPAAEKVAALLFFNVGVEAGQLLLVAVALGGWAGLRAIARAIPERPAFANAAAAQTALAYAIGVAAAFWCAERIAGVFPA